MIKYIFILLTGFLVSIVTGCDNTNLTHSISMVPRPAQMMPGSGNHLFSDQTVFVVENEEQAEVARSLIALFTRTAGFTPKLNVGGEGNVRLLTDPSLKSEAYSLEVSPQEIIIKASDNKGFFYALQTIRQLLPPSIERESLSDKNLEWSIPVVTIQDEPRFGYRALLLDASRFFIPKENVLRIIDCMSMLKLNTLHFHLTDDNGWRVEIKKYPRLTEVGAWRVDRQDLPFPARRNPKKGEPTPVGGFYTQEDIREMVAYAAEHHVTIVPEIDIPGHMLAALTAYPSLGCIQKGYQVGTQWGIYSDVLCAGNAACYTFLKDVMQEVIELFPGPYIHIGGDECPNERWKSCEKCQSWMRKNHISDEYALQSYVIEYVGKYLKKHHKRLIGWDEILEGGIGREAVIMSWRGVKGGITAAKAGNLVIMAPNTHMYLNHYQSNMLFEPLAHGRVASLEWVYSFNPIPDVLTPEEAKKVLGIQGNVWTEYLPTYQLVEYMAYPRASAVAEIGWSQPENRNWKDYLKRLQIQFERWRYYQVNCALHYKLP